MQLAEDIDDDDDYAEVMGPWGTYSVPKLGSDDRNAPLEHIMEVESCEEAEAVGPWGTYTVPCL